MAEKAAEKKRILLVGDNGAVMDDVFGMLDSSFSVVSSSIRLKDMENHVIFFEPDIIILCIGRNDENNQRVVALKRKFTRANIIFGIVGKPEECAAFQKMSSAMADIVMTRPIDAKKIKQTIWDYLEEQEMIKEAEAEQQPEVKEFSLKDIFAGMSEEKLEEPQAAPQASASNTAPQAQPEQAPFVPYVKEKKHVLVIDDDPMMLKIVKDHLHEHYDVATAISGKIAYKFLEKKKTDMILLDYEMPEENGPAVFFKLRQNPALSRVPIIFLTGVADRNKIREVLSLKPQGYLLKPIDKEKLLGTLDKFA